MIPGIALRKYFQIKSMPDPRILKSHSWYMNNFPRTVYIVRDGRDVLISLYHYLITRRGLGDQVLFPDFFSGYINGYYGHLWHENVISWLTTGKEKLGDNLYIVRFEDIKRDEVKQFSKIADFVGLPVDSSKIKEAIEMSSLNKMQKLEAARLGSLESRDESFYRGGRTGEWQEYFTPFIEKKFLELSSIALKLAGYDL